MVNISLSDFMCGVALTYKRRGATCEVAYRTDVGVYVTENGVDFGVVETDDVGARRIYWNLTGGKE